MGKIQSKYTANTGMVTISTADSTINGSGPGVTLVLTAASNGTLIKSVIIKAQTNTHQGMIRFYVHNGSGNPKLLLEVEVEPIITRSARDFTFYQFIPIQYFLQSGYKLYVSSETADTFSIIAEGLDLSYSMTYTELSIEYTANTGIERISTANSNLNGTGTCLPILSAGGGSNGCQILSILVKAQQNVTPGMVRLYLQDNNGLNNTLFAELVIPYYNYSGTAESFTTRILLQRCLTTIQAGYKILASTENNESFSVIIEGRDWIYLN